MKKPPKSARASAIALLGSILGEKQSLDEALAKHPLGGPDSDQKFTRMMVITTLRHLGQIDDVLAAYLTKPLPKKREGIVHALRIGVAQLLLLATPAHAAVNETVQAVKQGRDSALAGLVNAILQRIVREKPALPLADKNIPEAVRKRWENIYSTQQIAAMAGVFSQRAPLDMHCTVAMEGAQRLDTHMVRLPADHEAVETLPGYAEGAFFVQDIAASYPARMLGDVKGLHVLDVCAAPGGKTSQLAQAEAMVTALDRSRARMKILKENMVRLGLAVEEIVGDMMKFAPEQPFDAILLDAPCSATGTARRHPEVLHIVGESDIAELSAIQRAILTRAWGWLKPGGRMVYCVCSLEREEGEAQAEWFLSATPDASLVPIDSTCEIPTECVNHGMLRTLPSHMADHGGMDGFFAACFRKA